EINAGTVLLNAGNNTLPVFPTATIPAVSTLGMNGGTLDLGGNSPAVGTLTSVNALPGTGGTVTNSSTAAVSFIADSATSSTYGGAVTNNAGTLSFYKQGGSTLTLTGTSTYSGPTFVEGGTLTLRDGGVLA